MANEDLFNLIITYQNCLVLAICLILIILLFAIIILFASGHKKAKKYVEAFKDSYDTDEKVLTALQSTSECFRKNSREAKAIAKAVFYINNSILRDYKTAFAIIEKSFKSKKVVELHKKILEKEKEKKNTILLLTAK